MPDLGRLTVAIRIIGSALHTINAKLDFSDLRATTAWVLSNY